MPSARCRGFPGSHNQGLLLATASSSSFYHLPQARYRCRFPQPPQKPLKVLERGYVGLTEWPKRGRVGACERRYWDTLGYLLIGMLQGLFAPLDLDHPRPVLINSVARLFNLSNSNFSLLCFSPRKLGEIISPCTSQQRCGCGSLFILFYFFSGGICSQ